MCGKRGLPDASDTTPLHTFAGQPEIGVVRPQTKAEFGARREHPVRFGDTLRRQVVHHHTKIRVRSVKPNRSLAAGQPSGVDPRQYALRGGFLVSGGAVDLTCEEQAGHRPQFQAAR